MKKILPLNDPPITTFPSYAAALGILSSYEKTFDWFYSQYIQLCTIEIQNAYKDENTLTSYIPCFFIDTDTRNYTNLFSDSYFVMRTNCPYLSQYEMPSDLIVSLNKSFVSVIKQSIDLDMYIFSYIDVTKVKRYAKLNFDIHTIFIYGYNDAEKIVYFADFPINGRSKYAHATCSYDEIESAFSNILNLVHPLNKSIGLIKFTDKSPYVFDLSYVKDSITEYLTPDSVKSKKLSDYASSVFSFLDWDMKARLGIDVYDFFHNHMNTEVSVGHGLSIEMFHGLYDHKEMMIKRVEYFVKQGYLSEDKLLFLSEYKKVRDNALILRNIVLKYNIQKKDNILIRVELLLYEMKEIEDKLLRNIFDIE